MTHPTMPYIFMSDGYDMRQMHARLDYWSRGAGASETVLRMTLESPYGRAAQARMDYRSAGKSALSGDLRTSCGR